jgi:hypothetical protein
MAFTKEEAMSNLDEVRKLKETGPEPNVTGQEKEMAQMAQMALMAASHKGDLEEIKRLVEAGAKPNVTMVQWALGKPYKPREETNQETLDTVKLLVELGADIRKNENEILRRCGKIPELTKFLLPLYTRSELRGMLEQEDLTPEIPQREIKTELARRQARRLSQALKKTQRPALEI